MLNPIPDLSLSTTDGHKKSRLMENSKRDSRFKAI